MHFNHETAGQPPNAQYNTSTIRGALSRLRGAYIQHRRRTNERCRLRKAHLGQETLATRDRPLKSRFITRGASKSQSVAAVNEYVAVRGRRWKGSYLPRTAAARRQPVRERRVLSSVDPSQASHSAGRPAVCSRISAHIFHPPPPSLHPRSTGSRRSISEHDVDQM